MKAILLLVTGLTAGYFLYPVFHPRPEAVTISDENLNQFKDFVDKEAKSFAEYDTAEDKLKAAEAMYGKMMVLFLAHLGLKSNYEFKPVVPEAKVEATPKKIDFKEVTLAEKVDPVLPVKRRRGSQEEKKNVTSNKEIKTDEERYDQYRSAQYIDKFDVKSKRLLGIFRGTLKHDASKNEGRVDNVLMEFNLHQDDNKITGDTLVVMADSNNVEYSRNAGSGGNRAMKSSPQDADSYYVDASPTSYFLINLKDFPEVSGQYFEKGKLVGTVKLFKTDRY